MAREKAKLRLGVSACLLGRKVRYDGGHKRDPFLVDVLGPSVEWVPVCPEEELGLGVPREPIRLVGSSAAPRLVGAESRRDHTEAMRRLAEARVRGLAGLDLDGYVTKAGSPSCGLEGVPVHGERGGRPRRDDAGAFFSVLLAGLPGLPVVEEGRLEDPAVRERFFERVAAYASGRKKEPRGERPRPAGGASAAGPRRSRRRPPVLVTGATGFVGRALVPALLAAGHRVRASARRLPARPDPRVEWIAADLSRSGDLPALLAGTRAAFFLVHGMAGGSDYPEVERRAAAGFAREAARAGLERLVYLGGVRPQGAPSRHLASRLAVGEVLRAGGVPALELRASMIVGPGSASWQIVRDLALRLPAVVLPAWARSRTRPVAIEDVVAALVAALDVPLPPGGVAELPGPEVLTIREILERVAALRGRALPAVETPLTAARLSTLWLKLVSDADWRVARELVLGLEHDLLPAAGASFWPRIRRRRLVSFDAAVRGALAAERPAADLRGALRALGEELVAAVSAPPPPAPPRAARGERGRAGAARRGSRRK